jgi:glucose-6-phosphate isomerase
VSAQREHPGLIEAGYRAALEALVRDEAIPRLYRRDATLWTGDSAAAKTIRNRLGWLDSPGWAKERIPELRAFAELVRERGVTRVLLLGMGGSSLAPEVFARVLGSAHGAPSLDVLDSTVPAAVRSAEGGARLDRTFVLVSSKSGKTLETLSQYRYFRARMNALGEPSPAARFAAVTDPGSELDRLAKSEGIATVFRNPADIGGRYSALSYFGMVPAALLSVHLEALLARAEEARVECMRPGTDNSALRLGSLLGAAAKAGRNKLTILAPPELRPLGYWIEQLIAESTGKSGTGIVPVEGEPVGSPSAYGDDRVFVFLTGARERSEHLEGFAEQLRHAGAPVVTMTLEDRDSVAGAFYRWEVATAVAGIVLGINPFDEPNVQESKENTARILAAFEEEGVMRPGVPRTREGEVEVYAGDTTWERISTGAPAHPGLEKVLGRFLLLAQPGDYVALLGYIERTASSEAFFGGLRRLVRDALRLPVLQGYGPRYLHSIGQLYKGGPPRGLFLLFTEPDAEDLEIPGARFHFGDLKTAQAFGDLASLETRGKPTLRLHFTAGADSGLAFVTRAVERALVALAAGA